METFTAKQAREIALESNEGELISIYDEIKIAARRGEISTEIKRPLNPAVIEALVDQGYRVEAGDYILELKDTFSLFW
jgi:hypothetical protein